MIARIHDPVGPRWTRIVLPALAVAIAAFDVFGMPGELGPGMFVGVALAALAPALLGRHAPRRAEIAVGDGLVRVRRAGLLTQTLRAKAITGASATVSDDGVSLALAQRDRPDHPILLELATEKDADEVRSALGVGHFGTGMLTFHASRQPSDVTTLRLRVVLAIAAIAAAGFRMAEPVTAFPVAIFMLLVLGFVWLTMQRLAKNHVAGRIALDRHGLHHGHASWVDTIPFTEIDDVQVIDGGLLVTRNGSPVIVPVDMARHRREGLSPAEVAHVVEQVRTAARRAHGQAKPAPDAGSTEELARRGADARTWLARLDAAAKMLGAQAQYRGAGVNAADLWSVLENPDAPAEMRAAAARVLVGADGDARPRIERALVKVREPDVEARIRVMLEPDVESVMRELDEDPSSRRVSPG